MMFGGMLLWPLLIIGLVWLLVQSQRGGGSGHEGFSLPRDGKPSARRLLDERYARGEIDRDEYLQRREDLGR